MRQARLFIVLWVAAVAPALVQPALAQSAAASLPPPVEGPVEFARDVAPILHASCARCHARGVTRGRFSIETREALLRGGDGGPAVVPGRSDESLLIALVAGLDPSSVMPEKGPRLTAEQVGVLRAWIDTGAAWDETVSFARTPPANLAPRAPVLPAASAASGHPVDRLLAPYMASHHVEQVPVDDRVLARRLYFDIIGVPPSPAELRAFLDDADPDRRAALVRRLLADRARFAEHWLSFWNDALRNDYRGTGYIDGGRTQISAWLFTALATNVPYDRFVEQLVNPAPGAEGFTRGIVWRGVVNASERPEMQAAQNIAQVFMGVNLKCASCHDSFVNDWQLADAYGLAGVYADAPLEMVECDRPTGQVTAPRFIYPGLGEIDRTAPRATRVQQLAELMTSRANGRLPRTIVNRLWARLMGHGLVEPLDDMDRPAWAPDLLDWLAEDLVAHGFDLKRTMEVILTSRAYQSAAVDVAADEESPAFRGPAVRRLTAEQFVDAVSALTGAWQSAPAPSFDFAAAGVEPPSLSGRTRAALTTADPLMIALGRPNREQVVTARPTAATTLQALELVNGTTLAGMVRAGATRLADGAFETEVLIDAIYARAFGRPPTPAERDLAREVVGSPARRDGVEDLLWAIVMLPEFQLLY
jgi:hypothetical protein